MIISQIYCGTERCASAIQHVMSPRGADNLGIGLTILSKCVQVRVARGASCSGTVPVFNLCAKPHPKVSNKISLLYSLLIKDGELRLQSKNERANQRLHATMAANGNKRTEDFILYHLKYALRSFGVQVLVIMVALDNSARHFCLCGADRRGSLAVLHEWNSARLEHCPLSQSSPSYYNRISKASITTKPITIKPHIELC